MRADRYSLHHCAKAGVQTENRNRAGSRGVPVNLSRGSGVSRCGLGALFLPNWFYIMMEVDTFTIFYANERDRGDAVGPE